MGYVTQSDLETMFGADRVAQVFTAVSLDGSSTGIVDPDRIAQAITMASAEFDGLMIGAYPSPWTQPYPPLVVRYVAILTMHQGMLARPECSAMQRENVPYYNDWAQARDDIKELRKGLMRVNAETKPAQISKAGVYRPASSTAPTPSYFNGPNGMGGY